MEILLFIILVLIVYSLRKKKKSKVVKKTLSKEEKKFLKEKGDIYEKFIGHVFEKKGDVVIYNGFIRGYKDEGVDIISISMKRKTIELIQCKDWTKKRMYLKDIEIIYKKLNDFDLSHISYTPKSVKMYLQIKRTLKDIGESIKSDKEKFVISKTLYMSSDTVIDFDSVKCKQIKSNIFQYEDMKIVILGI